MSTAVGSIDHVVIVVDDLVSAAETYRRLGFTLSPRGQHSAAMGTANHTLMLQHDYFELLTVLAPTERNAWWRRTLGEGGGVGGFALQTDDPQGAFGIWSKAGFDPVGPIAFSRPVLRQDGSTMEARFETVSIAEVPETDMRVFVCSQPTREAVWLPELMEHANTAVGIKRLIVSSPDPARASKQWLRVVPHAKPRPSPDGVMLDLVSHTIEIVRPDIARKLYGASVPDDEPRGVGIAFAVRSIEGCREQLVAGGIAHTSEANALCVPPRNACNTYLSFEHV
jgi:catechol 2,3-dioxygenase-like lactoylglutathione lyase family enzyme